MSLLQNSFMTTLRQGSMDVIHEVGEVTHELVHSLGQPIQNMWHDSKQVVGSLSSASHAVIRLTTYWAIGWLGWTAFTTYFPDESEMINESVDRALKRARVR